MKKLLFVYNPLSGKGQIASYLSDIIDVFVKNEYEVTVYPTQSRGYAKKLVSDVGSNYDMIVCSGGDGTLNETISGKSHVERRGMLARLRLPGNLGGIELGGDPVYRLCDNRVEDRHRAGAADA